MKKVKVLTAICLVCILATLCFCLVGCKNDDEGNNYSETFAGKASEQTYETKEDAINDFLKNEVSGTASTAVLENIEKENDLTSDQIKELELTPEEAASLISAENYVITYSDTQDSSGVVQTVAEKIYRVRIIILTFEDFCKYYVPPMEEGDILNKSYYDSVFDAKNYANCTITMNSVSGAVGISATIDITMKITESAVYLYMSMSAPDFVGNSIQQVTETMEAYLLEDTAGLKVIARQGQGSWTVQSNTGLPVNGTYVTSIEGVLNVAFNQQQDWSMFVKTNYGFEIRPEKLGDYLKTVLNLNGISAVDTTFSVKYYVREGRLVETVSDISYKTQGMSVNAKSTETITDFGNTTVDIPAEVSNLIG